MAMSEGLIGHWTFEKDSQEVTGAGLRIREGRVEPETAPPHGGPAAAARFNGIDNWLEVEDHPLLHLGTGDFSVAAWIHTDGASADVVGDIISKFDPATRRGFSLGVVTNSGVTSTAQSNYRHLHFGIDNGRIDGKWKDCGRPGKANHVYGLAAVEGQLYAGTFELGSDGVGHLWRYAGGRKWTDLGAAPDGSSGVPTVAYFNGAVYCGTGRYNPHGSCLGPAQNTAPGGHVYRVESDGQWIDCGKPGSEDAVPDDQPAAGYETGKADEVTSLTVYHGELYATSHHRRGAFKYEGGKSWKYIGPNERLMTFTIYQDRLYTLVNGGPVYRYEGGSDWTQPAGGRPHRGGSSLRRHVRSSR